MANTYSRDQLNSFPPEMVTEICLFLQDQLAEANQKLDQTDQQLADANRKLDSLNGKMQQMMEQLILSRKERFGRSSELMPDSSQICFMEVDGNIVFFNEAEAVADLTLPEPETLEDVPKRGKKSPGKREEDLKGLPTTVVSHYLSAEQLTEEFGEHGWKQLPDIISKHYIFIPAKVGVEEHHIGVYASKKDDHMVKAPHPKKLLKGSLVSPSLGAAIINGKYVNAVPLYRLEQEFSRNGLRITRQNMANWMIRLADEYLGPMYDRMHELLLRYHVIQADETPVTVNKDGRPAGSKSYMWVYRSGYMYPDKPVVLYEYQATRNASHPREFLKDFSGVCVTDGYQVYHTIADEREDLTIAGCWVHMRRRFDEAQKVVPVSQRKDAVSYLVMKQIQAVYREEDKLKELSSGERLEQRRLVIAPLVNALFSYLHQKEKTVSKTGKLHDAFTYALNQEKYLRVFLEDGDVPMDNNASERAIRGFCIGKKNWEFIDTIRGAKSSAIIYSIAETAKANNLKPYDYFEYLLSEMPEHMEDTDRSFLDNLMPWASTLPDHIRKPQ